MNQCDFTAHKQLCGSLRVTKPPNVHLVKSDPFPCAAKKRYTLTRYVHTHLHTTETKAVLSTLRCVTLAELSPRIQQCKGLHRYERVSTRWDDEIRSMETRVSGSDSMLIRPQNTVQGQDFATQESCGGLSSFYPLSWVIAVIGRNTGYAPGSVLNQIHMFFTAIPFKWIRRSVGFVFFPYRVKVVVKTVLEPLSHLDTQH